MSSIVDIPGQRPSMIDRSGQGNTGSRDRGVSHVVYRTFEELCDVRTEWDEFVERNGGDLYSSFDWCRVWWSYYGSRRRLEVHVFRAGGDLVGLIPTFRETLWIGPVPLRLIRLVGCDHSTTTCGLVLEDHRIGEIVGLLATWLAGEGAWDMLQWGPLAGYFAHREPIVARFGERGDLWEVRHCAGYSPHIVWDLPQTYEEYLGGLAKKERSNIRIGRKRLAGWGLVLDCAGTSGELDRWFSVFVEQHQEQWRAEGRLGHFADWPKAEEFHQELAHTMRGLGRLWLLRLEVEGQPIGFQYNYRFGRRIHWLLGSRDLNAKWDALSPGRTLHSTTIEQAIQEGFRSIDGLRGMYDYKLRLGGKVTGLQSITLVRRGPAATLKMRLARVFSRLLDLLYYRIWFGRLAPKLPLPRRGLWRLWIRSRI